MKRTMLRSVITLLTLGIIITIGRLTIVAQNDGIEQNNTGRAGTFAIVGARVVTVSGIVIENGTVIIKDGKIDALGVNIAVPSGAEKIDGKGLSVYPGMIDAATNIGLAEISLGVNGSMDVAEVGDQNANAKAIKGINPNSSHISVTRVNGTTTALSYPNGGTIAGQAAVIDLNGRTQAEMAVIPEFGLVIDFPRVSAGGGFGGFGGQQMDIGEALKRRDSQIDELRKVFKKAAEYAKARDAYAKDRSLPFMPDDLKMDAMIPYVRGERPVLFMAERERDIRAVARFVKEMALKGIIIGGQEAWRAADDLKANNIAVIYTNIYSLPVREDDAYDELFAAPSKMRNAGIKFCIASGNGGEEARDLPYHAGIAGAFGLTPEESLKAVTLWPAQILGLSDKMGSIEAGKSANIVVTDGDLLQPTTNVKYLFITGKMIPLTSRHTRLFDAFKDKK